MKRLQWQPDIVTATWARDLMLPKPNRRRSQYAGDDHGHVRTWTKHIQAGDFPDWTKNSDGHLVYSPRNIIRCWRSALQLEALALTIQWGGMSRTKNKYIYTADLPVIRRCLRQSQNGIRRTKSIQGAWALMERELDWSPVIISKTLHFLTRAEGFTSNPPVPIDNAVIREVVWHWFRQTAKWKRRDQDRPLPQSWMAGWDGYNRYMTAINIWATQLGWSTTDVENRLFASPPVSR